MSSHGHTSNRRHAYGRAGSWNPTKAWGQVGLPDQHCLLWEMEKENFNLSAFFLRQPLAPAGFHRECQGIAWACGLPGTRTARAPWDGRVARDTRDSPSSGHCDGDRLRFSRVQAQDGPSRAGPQGPDTGVTQRASVLFFAFSLREQA